MTVSISRGWLVACLLRAGLTTGIVDGLFACFLFAVVYDSTVMRLWQGVASTVIGREAFAGGTQTALIGLLMHFGVAFWWSAIFLFVVVRSPLLRRTLNSRYGVYKVAAVYGPLIWLVMSLAVIPLLVRRPPVLSARWTIQLVGHIFFVGIPIVASIRSGLRVGFDTERDRTE